MVHCIPHGQVAGYGHVAVMDRSSTGSTTRASWPLWNQAPPRLGGESFAATDTLPCKGDQSRSTSHTSWTRGSRGARLARAHESICLESQLSQVVGTLFSSLWKMIKLLDMAHLAAPSTFKTPCTGAYSRPNLDALGFMVPSAGEQVIAKVLAQAMSATPAHTCQ